MTQAMMFATGQMPALKGNALSVHARRFSSGIHDGRRTNNSQTQLDVLTSENDDATFAKVGVKELEVQNILGKRQQGMVPSDRHVSPSTGFRLSSNYKQAPSYPESIDYNHNGLKQEIGNKRNLLNNTMLKSGATIMGAGGVVKKGSRNSH